MAALPDLGSTPQSWRPTLGLHPHRRQARDLLKQDYGAVFLWRR